MNQPFPLKGWKFLFPLVLFISVLLLVTCEEESSESRDYPRLTGMQISNISDEGATFTADLYSLGSSSIMQHGFLWGNSRDLELEYQDRIYLGPISQTGFFSAEIRTALTEGKEYFVRPFVTIPGKKIYGPVISFKSHGSAGPVITGFQPDSAMWADTLKIFGKNFSWVTNEVFLNEHQLSILKTSDTLIIAVVESTVKSEESNLTVSTSGIRNTFLTKKFRLIHPSVTEFNPKQAYWGDTIIIRGKLLSYISTTGSFVKLGTLNCPVIYASSSDSVIKIKVPNELSSLNSQLTLNVFGINIALSVPLTLIPPHYSFLPTEGTWGNVLTLKGRFHPTASKNVVEIGGKPASIYTFSTDSLTVSVPKTLINHKNSVTLKTEPFTINSPDTFHLYEPIITSISPLKGRSSDKIYIRGKYLHSGYYQFLSEARIGNINLIKEYNYGDSVIVFEIPPLTENISSQIAVMAGNQTTLSEDFFTVVNPQITDFSPKTGTFNENITLKGKYFMPIEGTSSPNIYFGNSDPYFGNNLATIVSFNDSIVVAKVPVATDSIPFYIRVKVDGVSSYSYEKFTLTPPEIVSVSPNTIISPGIDITINGTGFNPVPDKNNVSWDVYPMIIKSVTPTSITATLPSIISRNNARINIGVAGYKRSSQMIENQVTSKWNKVAQLPKNIKMETNTGGRYRSISFSLNGKGYAMNRNGTLICFDPTDLSISICNQNNVFAAWSNLESVVCNDTAYAMGTDRKLYRFEPGSKSWISMGINSPLPGDYCYGELFALNGKIFCGVINNLYYNGQLNRSMWELDKKTKSWKQRESLPAISYSNVELYFSMNNRGYILFEDNKFYEYNPVNDTWMSLKDFPEAANSWGKNVLIINDTPYIGLGKAYPPLDKFYSYDRIADSWNLVDRIPYGGRFNAISFVISNKGYILSGYNHTGTGTLLNDILEFDPSYY